jgi:protein-tyrosine phosphatase
VSSLAEPDRANPDHVGVLFVCTGNQCRSPMAASLLRARVASIRPLIEVASAGFIGDGFPAPPNAIDSMAEIGLDISGQRSRLVNPAMISSADLVIGMSRQHVLELAVMAPDAWGRSFGFRDLLRRADMAGPRRRDEDVAAWAQRLHAGRSRASLLQLPLSDDVDDPMGRSRGDFDATRDLLDRMTARLAHLLGSA